VVQVRQEYKFLFTGLVLQLIQRRSGIQPYFWLSNNL